MAAEPVKGGGEPVLCVESVLASVVVHSVGAVCARRARCVLPARLLPSPESVARVRIEGLPVTLYEHSLRGRVLSGPPGLRVTDVRVEWTAAPRQSGELPGLRLELEEAEDRRDGLRERRDRLTAEIEEVAGLRAVPPQPRRGEPPRWAPVESILALAGFLDGRLALLHERLRTVEDDLRRAEHDVEVLSDRLRTASSALPTARTRESATAVLSLDRAGDGEGRGGAGDGAGSGAAPETGFDAESEVEFEVEYHVPGATWSPVYQLRLADAGAGSGGTLVLRACVAQRTGEDWTGVRLGLSTADLLRRTDVPRLRSLRLGRRQAEPSAPGWRELPPGLEELFAGYDAAVASRPSRTGRPDRPGSSPAGAVGRTAALPVAPPPAGAPPPRAGAVPVPAAPAAAAPPSPGAADLAHAAGGTPHEFAGYGGPPVAAAPAAYAPEAAPLSPEPPRPDGELLDYARLTLAGPDEPGRRGRLRPAPDGGPDAGAAEQRRRAEAVARQRRPSHTVDVRHSAGSFHHRYDTAAPVDVAADGAWHTVPVCEVPVETVAEYVCVPSVDQTVYGTVLLTNTSPHALLAGPADVTVNGDFVLTAPLPTLAPGECRRVGVGAVESVRVARRTHLRESTAGLRGGTTVLDHTVEVELANRLPHPVTVEVRERVPVSDDKDVRIEERPAAPPWQVRDEPLDGGDGDGGHHVRGARVWRVELEPGRTAVLQGGYEIRIPAGKALVGGNRRD